MEQKDKGKSDMPTRSDISFSAVDSVNFSGEINPHLLLDHCSKCIFDIMLLPGMSGMDLQCKITSPLNWD